MAYKHKPIPLLTEAEIDRFNSKIDKRGPDECWPWLGALVCGYGRFEVRREGKPVPLRAPRVLLFIRTGTDPGPLLIRHTCDNPPCMNEAHHLLGDREDNRRDMIERNRQYRPVGELCPVLRYPELYRGSRKALAKFTEDQIPMIRQMKTDGIHAAEIARRLGVTHDTIGKILRCETWTHA